LGIREIECAQQAPEVWTTRPRTSHPLVRETKPRGAPEYGHEESESDNFPHTHSLSLSVCYAVYPYVSKPLLQRSARHGPALIYLIRRLSQILGLPHPRQHEG